VVPRGTPRSHRIEEQRTLLAGQLKGIGEPLDQLAGGLPDSRLNFLDGGQDAAGAGGQLGLRQIQGFAPPPQPVAKG
jgi:hypothetical protein